MVWLPITVHLLIQEILNYLKNSKNLMWYWVIRIFLDGLYLNRITNLIKFWMNLWINFVMIKGKYCSLRISKVFLSKRMIFHFIFLNQNSNMIFLLLCIIWKRIIIFRHLISSCIVQIWLQMMVILNIIKKGIVISKSNFQIWWLNWNHHQL